VTIIGNDLSLSPLEGKSGQAYIGTYQNGERIFVKRDTSPILPALAKV
jgi:thiamine kinase-like enzyme